MDSRPSAKIAIFVVGALGTIAALHFTIFKARATAYETAKSTYEGALSAYMAQGSAKQLPEINRFRYQTLRVKLDYWKTVLGQGILVPPYPDPRKPAVHEQRQKLWDLLRELEKRRAEGEEGKGPKLAFLAENQWNLVDSLPKPIIEKGIQVDDLLSNLRNEDLLLQTMPSTGTAFRARSVEYDRLLAGLGVNVRFRTALADNFGDIAAALYTLNRIDQVKKNLPADFSAFADLDENGKLDQLYSLFRMQWPRDERGNANMFLAERQASAFTRILDIAKESQIEEISRVKLFRFLDYRYTPPKAAGDVAAAPAPAAPVGGDPYMDPSFGGGENFAAYGKAGGEEAAQPVGELVGSIGPMEIVVAGSNSAVTTFMHRIVNDPRILEVDRVQLRADPKAEDRLIARLFINLVTYANFAKLTTDIDAQREIVNTKIEMAELAFKVGARDEALKDKFLVGDSQNPRLAEPSPTPWPTPVPTPEPTQPPQ